MISTSVFLTKPLLPRLRARFAVRAMLTVTPVKLMLVRYEFVDGMLEKRTPYREDHLKHAKNFTDKGHILIAGATGESAAGGLAVMKGLSSEEVEMYVKNDPYFQNGLVTKWSMEPYTVVEGTLKDNL